MTDVTISVITATYNAAEHLPRLIESLAAQTDQDFEWVVADGASTDGTLELLEQAKGRLKCVIIDSRPDFGIYDALNRAIKLSSGEYYLVVGADDELFPEAIKEYKRISEKTCGDIISFPVRDNGKILFPNRGMSWLRGQQAYVSHHAVGTLIKKSLHQVYGYYSNRFSLVADQLFIKNAIQGGACCSYCGDYVVGIYGRYGKSSTNIKDVFFQFSQVQWETENFRSIQLFLLVARLLKYWVKGYL